MNINRQLMDFLNKSSSNFHAVNEMRSELINNEFIELKSNEVWKLEKNKKYFMTVNGSAIIAFDLNDFNKESGFKIVASHTDAPNFKVKPSAVKIKNGYVTINTEAYGGLINYAWFDRPLKMAGRVIVKNNDTLETKLFDSNKAIAFIPSLAIHMNRKVNEEAKFNRHTDMSPIISQDEVFDLKAYLAKELNVNSDVIIDYDLSFKPSEQSTYVGVNEEFISSNHLDNLQSAYVSLQSFIDSKSNEGINVYVSFDNEEVGSMTKQGAHATILKDVLERVSYSMGRNNEEHLISLSKSFIVSADNAHANHPNYPNSNDENHIVKLNGGVVIKYSANQKYTTDSLSASLMLDLAKGANVDVQTFVNRSDSPGGSTLGAISGTQVSIKSVDIGMPQLAMHSSMELSGSSDSHSMYNLLMAFYNQKIVVNNESITIKK